jgi:PhzF family phenazine biosynthesis protein
VNKCPSNSQGARQPRVTETTYLLPSASPEADYRVRIFTPARELPFAGHFTLGTCHAWLANGGTPNDPGTVVQECAAGLIDIQRTPGSLAFAAPPLLREGPVEPGLLARIASQLGIGQDAIVAALAGLTPR